MTSRARATPIPTRAFGIWLGAMAGLLHPSLEASDPVLRALGPALPATERIENGDFERFEGGRLSRWVGAPQGYRVATGEGRNGSTALVAENPAGEGWVGASQAWSPPQATAAPLVVSGWSKAENVPGSPGSSYALYVDLVYTDGTPLWGQTGHFRCGTHDWERREFVIHPEKPVRSVTLHCLFRGRSGKVWFDDVSVREVAVEGDTVWVQGAALAVPRTFPALRGVRERLATADGLSWVHRGLATEELRLGASRLTAGGLSGFLVRDVAASSGLFRVTGAGRAELGLALKTRVIERPDHFVVEGRIVDQTRSDRAVTLLFALPVDATGWHWGDDLRRRRTIEGRSEYVNQVPVQCGATGTLSLYPLAAVWNETSGLALGLDMARPAIHRLGYHAGLKCLFMAYDLGLVPEAGPEPGAAEFRFVIFRFDPRWGFRAAWAKYMTLFPEAFVVRARAQGLWMPFTDISRVPGWEDFGFRFHEGNNNVPWDDAHEVLSFRYTEPMTWWMPMPKSEPRTPAAAVQLRDRLLGGPENPSRRMAAVTHVAAMWDADGQPALQFQNAPWCDGAIWSLNPNPRLGGPGVTNAATVHWSDAIKARCYGPEARGRLDGEYLDSLEGYVTANLNFRREHFRHTTVPLTFTSDTHRPALFKGLAVAEFTRWIAEDLHRMDKLVFANGVPYRFAFLCPWLDVLGTETDWLAGDQYRPVPDATLCLWRTLAGAKPYLLLMNSDYDRFTVDRVERYFQRALAYGFWPGFFSHNAAENPYWQNPAWYERDRPIFRKYIPILRSVSEAGWHPVPHATVDVEGVDLERFGPAADGAVYFTVFNGTARRRVVAVRPDRSAFGGGATPAVDELVRGQPVVWAPDGLHLELGAEEVRVLRARL